MDFFRELKRRNVYKVAVTYAVVAWLVIQIATQTFAHLLEARIRANPHLWYQFYRYWDASDNG